MKTWKTIVVTLGLMAMSGVAWGHGATGRALGRDAVEPPETVAHARIDTNDVVGIPIGGTPRVKSFDATRRHPALSARVAAATLAPPRIEVKTIVPVAAIPILSPTVITMDRIFFQPHQPIGTFTPHHRPPMALKPR